MAAALMASPSYGALELDAQAADGLMLKEAMREDCARAGGGGGAASAAAPTPFPLAAIPVAISALLSGFAAAAAQLVPAYAQPSYHVAAGPGGGWVNDPCGLLFHDGVYHVFFQFSDAPSGNSPRRWAHAVSQDLATWRRLPDTLRPAPGTPDEAGSWSGAAGVDQAGTPYLLFTGASPWSPTRHGGPEYNEPRQMQLVARPDDPTDPLLAVWKTERAPLASAPPPGGNAEQFRDPSAPYATPGADDGLRRTLVGAQVAHNTFAAVVYASPDLAERAWDYRSRFFVDSWTAEADNLECPDLWPASHADGLWVFKWSVQFAGKSHERDLYMVGRVADGGDRFVPLEGAAPIPLDLGTFYASRTMDAGEGRRLLWGWSREKDEASREDARSWQGALTAPREVLFDAKRQIVTTLPARELEALRGEVLGKVDERAPRALEAPAGRAGRPGTAFARELAALGAGTADYDVWASAPPAAVRSLAVGVRLRAEGKVLAEIWLTSRGLHVFGKAVPSPVGGPLPARAASAAFAAGGRRSLRVLTDGTLVEAFAEGGAAACTARVYASAPPHLWSADVLVRGAAGHVFATAWAMGQGV